jgi:hypothetical protein
VHDEEVGDSGREAGEIKCAAVKGAPVLGCPEPEYSRSLRRDVARRFGTLPADAEPQLQAVSGQSSARGARALCGLGRPERPPDRTSSGRVPYGDGRGAVSESNLPECGAPMHYDLPPGSLAESDSVIAFAARRASHAVTCVYPHAVHAIPAPAPRNISVSPVYATNANRAPPTATKTRPQEPRARRTLGGRGSRAAAHRLQFARG